MRLLVIGINYAPEIIGTGVYSAGLADFMAQADVETHVVTAHPYYPAWKTFEGWGRPFWMRRTSEANVKITHCPIYVPASPSGAKRILHHISFALSAFPILVWKALFWRPDVILLVAPSLMSAPNALAIAPLAGAKTWLHVQDFEVEAAFATGLLDANTHIGKLAQSFERWALRRFRRVSTISKPMLEKLAEKGVAAERIVEVRNWANIDKVTPLEGPSPLREELGITTPHVAVYSGNLANKQGLESLPQMARHLSHRDDVTIAICGEGPMLETLKAMAQDTPAIRFFPLQPLDRLSDLLGMADVHLLPQIADAADLVLPSKLTNMLASGRPVLATTHAETALAEEVEGAGIVVPPGDAKAMAEGLEALLDAPERRADLGRKARERALQRWDMDAILTRLKAQFEALAAE